jgi:SOS-response transcriptional repressor LexA
MSDSTRGFPRAHDDAEWEEDQLVALMGRYLTRSPDAPVYDDERFLEWLMRELRASAPRADDLAPHRIREIRERVLRRAAAARVPMRLIDERWPERPASVVGPVMAIWDEAEREDCIPLVDMAVAAGSGRSLLDEPSEIWIPRRGVVPGKRHVAVKVKGDSMTPLLHGGDVLVVKPGPQAVRGTVVVAHLPDDTDVVKCVGWADSRTVELTSLNPAYEPIRVLREKHTILGTVLLRWCPHDGKARRRV